MRRLAAVNRNGVDVAEQLEDDGAAVGRDVERQPCSLIGRELEGLGRREREAGAATGGIVPASAALRGERRCNGKEGRDERGELSGTAHASAPVRGCLRTV